MAGMIRLHTDAATITPAAKPVNARWILSLKGILHENTQAGTEGCAEKRYQNTVKYIHIHISDLQSLSMKYIDSCMCNC